MLFRAALLKKEIEAKLAMRVPAALSPIPESVPRLHQADNEDLNKALNGGFPQGSLCEITGWECSGRSAIALSLLASASREGACAYIDVGDSCSPHSAAAAGVVLRNLLWVRLTARAEQVTTVATPAPRFGCDNSREVAQLSQQHCGGPHPRGETSGLGPALEEMLAQKDERKKRKMEGTPGYPNQLLNLLQASADQVEWEQFNSRNIDDRDPLRQLDKAAAEAARERAALHSVSQNTRTSQSSPWALLDRALRSTDQVLQAGGFRVVVLDLASVAPAQAQRIPSNSWWRFQKAAKHSDSILLVLSQSPCARSSADVVLECSAGRAPRIKGVLCSAQHIAQVSRQRTGQSLGKKVPGRVTNLHSAPPWMRAVGR